MKRLTMLLIKFSFKIVIWLRHINKMAKDDTLSKEEKYAYLHNAIKEVNAGCKVELKCFGLENLPEEQGYLITPNHQGMYDALALLGTHEKPVTAVLKKELVGKPIVDNVIKLVHAIPLDRSNLRASMQMIKEVTQRLQSGDNVIIFPEGTRSKLGNEMLEFKPGAYKSAMTAKKPVVPVALIDCFKVFDQNSKEKITAQIHYLKPICYDEYKDMSTVELANEVQSRIRKCIVENVDKYK